MEDLSFRAAAPTDWPAIASLLESSGLPTAGAQAHLGAFVVATRAQRLVGAVGLEVHGTAALLRSLAVADDERNTGIGRSLLASIHREAVRRNLPALYLLTTTAQPLFEKHGYVVVARHALPASLGASEELRGACPESAVSMMLALSDVEAGAAA